MATQLHKIINTKDLFITHSFSGNSMPFYVNCPLPSIDFYPPIDIVSFNEQ